MVKKILITGGAGFIGSHTADALIEKGYEVRVLDILNDQIHPNGKVPNYLNSKVEFIKGDVCNPEDVRKALDGIDYIYHFAAETGVGQSMYEVGRYFHNTVTGTAVLWEQIVKNRYPIKKIILSSSRAVYGEGEFICSSCNRKVSPNQREKEALLKADWLPKCPCPYEECNSTTKNKEKSILQVIPVDENTSKKPVSVYGYTKLHQEDICHLMGKIYQIPVVTLRYFNVFGPRQALNNPYTGVIANFFLKIINNNPITLYEHGLPVRDFVYVKDVVQANVKSLDTSIGSGIYNVGIGKPITIKELAEAIVDVADSNKVPIDITEKFRVGDIFGFFGDIQKTVKELGYRPQYTVREGLRELIESWKGEVIPEDTSSKAEEELKKIGLLHG